MNGIVYILILADGCFYVGWSRNLQSRLDAHFAGVGAAFTRLHRPVKLALTLTGDKQLEDEVTLRLAKRVGWERVRGGKWCRLTGDEWEKLRQANSQLGN